MTKRRISPLVEPSKDDWIFFHFMVTLCCETSKAQKKEIMRAILPVIKRFGEAQDE